MAGGSPSSSASSPSSSSRDNHKDVVANDKSWNPAYEPFFKSVINSKSGVKVKEAIEVGTKAVDYFRGIDFLRWIEKNKTNINSKFPKLMRELAEETKVTEASAEQVGMALIRNGFILKAKHQPIGRVLETTPQSNDGSSSSTNLTGGDSNEMLSSKTVENARWPKRLQITPHDQKFDAHGFYVVLYDTPTRWNYLILTAVLSVVFLACLFPIWPFRLKVAMWYLGVSLTSFILILSVIRLILYGLLWFAGFDFWLLPNLYNEDAGFIDSFIPGYTWEKRKDDTLMIGARIICAILCIGLFYKLSETHSFKDVSGFASKQFLDILDWGHQKLSNEPANPSDATLLEQAAANEPLDPEELRKASWKWCTQKCDFVDQDEFDEICKNDCSCLEEFVNSNCWKKCDPVVMADVKSYRETCTREEEELEEDSKGKAEEL